MKKDMVFIAIDFETATYSRDSACSVEMVKFLNGKARESCRLGKNSEKNLPIYHYMTDKRYTI
jgi:hypothetical protein